MTRPFTALRLAASLMGAALVQCANVAERPSAQALRTSRASPTASELTSPAATAPDPARLPSFFEELRERAKALAAAPPAPAGEISLPPELAQLDYDAYRKIRFRPERSLWRGEPGRFEVQFFHAGVGYRQAVLVFVLDRGKVRPIPFSSAWFSYEGLNEPPPGTGLEFTGLRLHTPLNTEDYRDEVVAFHGASYFRPVGKGNVYGLSARGLSIDLGDPRPEEFPRFTHFYLVRPGPGDAAMWILALLESRRATGAYAFRIQPGNTTLLDVAAELFVREPVAQLGIAPLTSMYLFGEETPGRFDDFRPEVHDSDGLSLCSGEGEWLFRPLRNPERSVVSSFRLDSPRGFGLVQRDRSFDHYQDLEARYQDRPSVWVEPVSGFGRGSVRLLEIATKFEGMDNIAMAWVPDGGVSDTLAVRYRLHVGNEGEVARPAGRAVATRLARTERGVRFLVDFAGSELTRRERVQVVVSSVGGRVVEQHVEENSFANGLRASFEVAPDNGSSDVELRAFMKSEGDVLTETWSYLWQPN